jgi:hypothetical protein
VLSWQLKVIASFPPTGEGVATLHEALASAMQDFLTANGSTKVVPAIATVMFPNDCFDTQGLNNESPGLHSGNTAWKEV